MIHSLTSLRLVFALMVFFSHCEMISAIFDIHILTEGYVGVEFFFVLSGFVISYGYDERLRRGIISNKDFWVARFARIYPLHWITLLVAAALGACTLSNRFGYWLRHFIANLCLCQAYIPQSDYYFSFYSPAWSLCCEQLFYFCFPFIVPVLRRPRHLFTLWSICAVIIIIGMTLTPPDIEKGLWYVNPLGRFPDFLLGMIVYTLYRNFAPTIHSSRYATWIEIFAIVFFLTSYIVSKNIPMVYRYSCYYWLPIAAIIFVFSLQQGFFSRILSSRFLVFGGEISFGFYMIHLLLFRMYEWSKLLFSFELPPVAILSLLLTITFLLSAASYYCFEKPINNFIRKKFMSAN